MKELYLAHDFGRLSSVKMERERLFPAKFEQNKNLEAGKSTVYRLQICPLSHF